jgi:hypothetical protein
LSLESLGIFPEMAGVAADRKGGRPLTQAPLRQAQRLFGSDSIRTGRQSLVLTRFLHANRYSLRWKTLRKICAGRPDEAIIPKPIQGFRWRDIPRRTGF